MSRPRVGEVLGLAVEVDAERALVLVLPVSPALVVATLERVVSACEADALTPALVDSARAVLSEGWRCDAAWTFALPSLPGVGLTGAEVASFCGAVRAAARQAIVLQHAPADAVNDFEPVTVGPCRVAVVRDEDRGYVEVAPLGREFYTRLPVLHADSLVALCLNAASALP